jgi:hypothetical protein
MLDRPHPTSPTVYVASKSRLHPFWSALRAAGLNIIASWPAWQRNSDGIEPTNDEWRRHVQTCIEEASSADILLLYACNDDPDREFGSLIECGASLASGKQVYVVAPFPWPFLRNHKNVRSFNSLADAVSALVALNAGGRDAQ